MKNLCEVLSNYGTHLLDASDFWYSFEKLGAMPALYSLQAESQWHPLSASSHTALWVMPSPLTQSENQQVNLKFPCKINLRHH